MKIVFRTDSSLQIGSGHVMRCLTFATELRQRAADVIFVCREHPGNLISLIESKGFPVVRLSQTEFEHVAAPENIAHAAWLGASWQQDAADTITALGNTQPQWLIIDHYAIDRGWEKKLRPYVDRIMVIDDLADRPHECDLLLDQNLYQAMETRYENLVPSNCKNLLGPNYALLRPEFAVARKSLRQRDGQVRRVFVFFGGVDPANETEKALQALTDISNRQFEVDVVVGGCCLYKDQIRNFCAGYENFHYHCQIDNMAELMVVADLAIGAGGSTTWERCALGLPAVVMTLAANQKSIASMVANYGAMICLGDAANITVEQLRTALADLFCNLTKMKAMSKRGVELLDGTGAEVVCSLVLSTEVPS